MKIAVLGGGGREHAICWRLSQDIETEIVFCIPGNPGMEKEDKIKCHPHSLQQKDWDSLNTWLKANQIDLVIVGPEQPLIAGIADHIRRCGIPVLGPGQIGSYLEASKILSKEFMQRNEIPTSEFSSFTDSKSAIEFIKKSDWAGFVVKLDKVAQGKGVVVAKSKEQAIKAVEEFMDHNILKMSDTTILIEKVSCGKEISAFMLVDESSWKYLGDCCDYKRIRDNDEGPNTGGMGTYSPAHWVDEKQRNIIKNICQKTFDGLKKEQTPYRGIIFIGLMLDNEDVNVLEYNIRLGDPETQSLLPRTISSLAKYAYACATNKLDQLPPIQLSPQSATHIVLASAGYPGTEGVKVKTGFPITIQKLKHQSLVFYAGVSKYQELITAGGRVLGLTSMANGHFKAVGQAYEDIERVHFAGNQRRNDIGK
jgi:phosphoribosylamine--glycine ligase